MLVASVLCRTGQRLIRLSTLHCCHSQHTCCSSLFQTSKIPCVKSHECVERTQHHWRCSLLLMYFTVCEASYQPLTMTVVCHQRLLKLLLLLLLLLLLSLPHSYSTQIQASSSQRRWCSKIGNMAWLVEERKGISFDHGDQVARLYSC